MEGATSLLSDYAERIATIPTTKDKLAALASGAGFLQGKVNSLQEQVFQVRGEKVNFDYVSKSLIRHAAALHLEGLPVAGTLPRTDWAVRSALRPAPRARATISRSPSAPLRLDFCPKSEHPCLNRKARLCGCQKLRL